VLAVRGGHDVFDRARRSAAYDEALHHAILLLKYEEMTRLGDWFAERPAEAVEREGEAVRGTGSYRCPSILTGGANALTSTLG
jgi:hypothetical protein